MRQDQFTTGKELGRKAYAKILLQGKRWQSRNIPQWLRDNLLVPYYIAQVDDEEHLFMIQYPLASEEKVHFVLYARRGIKEHERST